MNDLRRRVLLFYCVLSLCNAVSKGAGGLADAVVAGLVSEREKLYSGDVNMRGREKRVDTAVSVSTEREIFERHAFNYQDELFHIDQLLTYLTPINENALSSRASSQVLVLSEDASYTKSVDAKQIVIGVRPDVVQYTDFRCFGMCSFDDMENKATIADYAATFHRAAKHNLLTVSEDRGLQVLNLEYGFNPNNPKEIVGRRRIWIDPERGHIPVRMEEQFKTEEAASAKWKSPHAISTATWKHVGDTWVPTSAEVNYNLVAPGRGTFSVDYDLAFEWNAVNKELDPILFTIEGLDVPPGSHVISDHSQRGEPVIVQHPGVPDAETVQKMNSQLPSNYRANRWKVFLIINLIVVCVLVLLILCRRLRRWQ